MNPKVCDKVHPECNRRFKTSEKDIDDVTKPGSGALAMIHEKINKRLTWIVFWSIMLVTFVAIASSFSFTKSVYDDQKNLVTKEYFKEFKEDILREIRDSRGPVRNDRDPLHRGL